MYKDLCLHKNRKVNGLSRGVFYYDIQLAICIGIIVDEKRERKLFNWESTRFLFTFVRDRKI